MKEGIRILIVGTTAVIVMCLGIYFLSLLMTYALAEVECDKSYFSFPNRLVFREGSFVCEHQMPNGRWVDDAKRYYEARLIEEIIRREGYKGAIE